MATRRLLPLLPKPRMAMVSPSGGKAQPRGCPHRRYHLRNRDLHLSCRNRKQGRSLSQLQHHLTSRQRSSKSSKHCASLSYQSVSLYQAINRTDRLAYSWRRGYKRKRGRSPSFGDGSTKRRKSRRLRRKKLLEYNEVLNNDSKKRRRNIRRIWEGLRLSMLSAFVPSSALIKGFY